MATKKHATERFNAFEESPSGDSLDQFTNDVFGAPALDDGRVTIRPIQIELIERDPAQPRRIIPPQLAGIRDMQALIEAWASMVEKYIGTLDIYKYVYDELDQYEHGLLWAGEKNTNTSQGAGFVEEFGEVLKLARSIRRDGLKNPISVTRTYDARYQIETGERRWIAYNVLNLVSDNDVFASIPARVVPSSDVWAQAAENGARRPLNAIGMARQLALLFMAMYEGRHSFSAYNHMIDEQTGCDRAFYAQVADGNQYRALKGHTQRILDVTGLKSKSQIAHYRALLNLDDEVWLTADANNWTEFAIRDYVQKRKDDLSAEARYERERFTTVNLNSENEADLGENERERFTTVNLNSENEADLGENERERLTTVNLTEPTLSDLGRVPDGEREEVTVSKSRITPPSAQHPPTYPPAIEAPKPADLDEALQDYYESLEPQVLYTKDLHLLDFELLIGVAEMVASRHAHGDNLEILQHLQRLSPRFLQQNIAEDDVTVEDVHNFFHEVKKILDGYYVQWMAEYSKFKNYVIKDAQRIATSEQIRKNKGS